VRYLAQHCPAVLTGNAAIQFNGNKQS